MGEEKKELPDIIPSGPPPSQPSASESAEPDQAADASSTAPDDSKEDKPASSPAAANEDAQPEKKGSAMEELVDLLAKAYGEQGLISKGMHAIYNKITTPKDTIDDPIQDLQETPEAEEQKQEAAVSATPAPEEVKELPAEPPSLS